MVQERIYFCENNMILYLHPLTKSLEHNFFSLQALVKFAVVCYMLTNVNQMKGPL